MSWSLLLRGHLCSTGARAWNSFHKHFSDWEQSGGFLQFQMCQQIPSWLTSPKLGVAEALQLVQLFTALGGILKYLQCLRPDVSGGGAELF